MATTTQIALPARAHNPVALWHLLSLDAPTVAAVWTWFIARATHIQLPLAAPAAMFLAVWILYAADRVLDGANADPADMEARHVFHHVHRRAFLAGIAVTATALATLLTSLNPAAIRLYLVEGALLFAWFIILHATRSARHLPKEIAVGLFFSAAAFIPTVARQPGLRISLLPGAILFAAVCSLNCLFIYAWEHDPYRTSTAHPSTRLALAHLPALSTGCAATGIALTLTATPEVKSIAAACTLSALLLLTLHSQRSRISRTGLRAAADMALLTPLLLLPFLR